MMILSDKFQFIQGNSYLSHFKPEIVEWVLNYQPRSRDRIMVTYPKSGTWWAEYIVTYLLSKNGQEPDTNDLFYRKYFMEYHGQELLNKELKLEPDQLKDVTFMRTHIPFGQLTFNHDAKYLIVLRNPKDVCVSFYYYFKQILELDVTFDDFFKLWITGRSGLPFGDYFKRVRDSWERRCESNCTIVVYEKLLKDPAQGIREIAEFLGSDCAARLDQPWEYGSTAGAGESLLDRIVQASSFDAMKGSMKKDDPHFRTGKSGGWRSLLHRPHSDDIDKRVAEEWAGTDLADMWAKELEW